MTTCHYRDASYKIKQGQFVHCASSNNLFRSKARSILVTMKLHLIFLYDPLDMYIAIVLLYRLLAVELNHLHPGCSAPCIIDLLLGRVDA